MRTRWQGIRTDAARAVVGLMPQGVEIPAATRQITVRGQVGVTAGRQLVQDARGQHRQCLANVARDLLERAAWAFADITESWASVTTRTAYRASAVPEERRAALGAHLVAATP